jgi:hypothetical protein
VEKGPEDEVTRFLLCPQLAGGKGFFFGRTPLTGGARTTRFCRKGLAEKERYAQGADLLVFDKLPLLKCARQRSSRHPKFH